MSEVVIIADVSGVRLDKYLSEQVEGLTRTKAESLIESGENCTVNGVSVTKKYKVKIGDVISVKIPLPQDVDIVAEDIPLDVRYEDSHVIVVNKPRGMVVHPSNGHYTGTLVNALMFHCKDNLSGINGEVRPGIVHRIDKDTSGLLIVAKNDAAHLELSRQLKEHTVVREYEAVVHGRVKNPTGIINAPIGRSTSDRKKMCVITASRGVSKTSREAVTHYEVLEYYDGYYDSVKSFTHVRLKLETGRTHQIRVHMAYIGHPVAGDLTYNKAKPVLSGGQCLHAKKLGFVHPDNGKYIEVVSELPNYFTDFLRSL